MCINSYIILKCACTVYEYTLFGRVSLRSKEPSFLFVTCIIYGWIRFCISRRHFDNFRHSWSIITVPNNNNNNYHTFYNTWNRRSCLLCARRGCSYILTHHIVLRDNFLFYFHACQLIIHQHFCENIT